MPISYSGCAVVVHGWKRGEATFPLTANKQTGKAVSCHFHVHNWRFHACHMHYYNMRLGVALCGGQRVKTEDMALSDWNDKENLHYVCGGIIFSFVLQAELK